MKAVGEGKTIEDAEVDALEKLEEITGALMPDQVVYKVISEGSKGFLGMGSAMAQVEASVKSYGEAETGSPDSPAGVAGEVAESPAVPSVPLSPEAEDRLTELLEKVSDGLGLEATVKVTDRGEEVAAELIGEDLGLFIGRHGSTMDAVQYLANIIVYRGLEDRKRIIVDAEEYRERREEVLRSLADRAASEVMKGKGVYEMKPMSAAERRIVHIHLQERNGIETSSEGREPFRRVIISRAGS
ncbi:MAG: Jag N-terminal domain-containing protein [Actinobacteria bacterium]|nr:Jag N-terminal domain-containing protein [Actinomycetota bacterium]